MANIPIVVVAYNRLESLKRITASLLQAEYPQGAELIISIDRGDNRDVAANRLARCFARTDGSTTEPILCCQGA